MNQLAVDQRLVTPSLFFIAACAISATPALNLFGEASPKGLLFTAGLSSATLMGTEVAVKMHSDSQANLAQKCGAVAFAVLLSPQLNKVLFPSVSLDYRCSLMFGTLEAGITGMVTVISTKPIEPPKPIKKKIAPQQVFKELDALKGVAHCHWKVAPETLQPNVNQVLSGFEDPGAIDHQKFKELYIISGALTINGTVAVDEARMPKTTKLENYFIAHLADPQTASAKELKTLLNQTFGYFLDKKRQIDMGVGGYKAIQELQSDLRTLFTALVDATDECVGQFTSQLEPIILGLVAQFNGSDLQKQASLALAQYRSLLLKAVIYETGDDEGADLERDLSLELHRDLGIEVPDYAKEGAFAAAKLYSVWNYRTAKRNFEQKYDPIQYLLDTYDATVNPKLFAELCKWYEENVFDDDMDGAVEQKLMEQLGEFHEDFMDRSDLAVLYFLQKNQIITHG